MTPVGHSPHRSTGSSPVGASRPTRRLKGHQRSHLMSRVVAELEHGTPLGGVPGRIVGAEP